MTASLKKTKIIFLVLFLALNLVNAQKIITVDYCSVDEDLAPFFFYDTIGILVHVLVDDTSMTNDNTATGDLYYWYQTDSMVQSGTSPRLINNSFASEFIPNGGKFDTIFVDLRPEEIRAGGPINIICLWATMQIPELIDTIPCCNNFGSPVLGEELLYKSIEFTFYPNPTNQYLYIQSFQINTIQEISIITMEGKIIRENMKEELLNGYIDLQFLQSGIYVLQLKLNDNSMSRTKILKQ